jgi:hypothetical protein
LEESQSWRPLEKTRCRWQFNKMNRTAVDRPISALFLKAVKTQKHIKVVTVHVMTHMGENRYGSIRILSNRWGLLVSFTLRSLYTWGKSPGYQINKMLVGPQSRSGHFREDKISFAPVGNRITIPYRTDRCISSSGYFSTARAVLTLTIQFKFCKRND